MSSSVGLASSFRSVPDLWHHRVGSTPDAEAMRYRDHDRWRSMSWGEAGSRVRAIANGLLQPDGLRLDLLAMAAAHLYSVYVLLACFGLAVSAMCDRRGTAVSICFLVVFYAFVLNFVATMWEPARAIQFTAFLYYYRPLDVTRYAMWRWSEIGVLLGAAAVWWVVGLTAWVRRDIPAR